MAGNQAEPNSNPQQSACFYILHVQPERKPAWVGPEPTATPVSRGSWGIALGGQANHLGHRRHSPYKS